jgi:2-dehydro-3-deoxyphosphooctonate aldolase (KDO 8-P synthase)
LKIVKIKDIEIGDGGSPVFVAGLCSMEEPALLEEAAKLLSELKDQYRIIMKFSYDKANRTSLDSYRGPGLDKGIEIIGDIKSRYDLPILVDVHCSHDVDKAAEVADCLQIPAFLCRQTDLVVAAAKTGKPVNVKKGQFLSPWAMTKQAEKILKSGNDQVILTERGSSFGYNELVVDMRSIIIMRDNGYPVLFDASHAQQQPPTDSDTTGGRKEFVLPLAKAARSVGADGIYCEFHPDPANAKSDRGTQLNFEEFKNLLDAVSKV